MPQIRDLVYRKFNKRACWLQIKIALSLRAGNDVVACAPTGAGKTLSFWIALLMALEEDGNKMIFVVTPLNLLGKQNVDTLDHAGLKAIAVSRENATAQTYKDIEAGQYRVVIINPELLMGDDNITKLWIKPQFTKHILYFTFDEGHCISQWGKFRKEYLQVGNLRYLIPETIPFYVASATLPPAVRRDIAEILHLRSNKTEYILRSNDRPEIRLMVRALSFPASSFRDLDFLIPKGFKDGDPPVPKFLVYREDELVELRDSSTWGLCCTDAFGMGMDLPDIKIVIQWKATCDLCTVWQRFGRVARGQGEQGTAILLVEKKDTDDGRVAKAARATIRKEHKQAETGTKRKARGQGGHGGKRRALIDKSINEEGGDELTGEGSGYGVTAEDAGAAEENDAEEVAREAAKLAFQEARRAHYAKRDNSEPGPSTMRKGKGRAGLEVGSAMDDFVNKPEYITCRRTVPQLYFQNDVTQTDDHLNCDETTEAGCARCAPKVSAICCDLCHPSYFEQFTVTLETLPRAPSKSSIKPIEMTTISRDLKTALLDWRLEEANKKFGTLVVLRLGAKLLISDETLDRLIICAPRHKVSTIEQLVRETGWKKDWAEELGVSLIEIIHKYFPPVPIKPTNVLTPSDGQVVAGPNKRKSPRCSNCGAEGHIKTNSNCPMRVAERAGALRAQTIIRPPTVDEPENIPPHATPPRPRPPSKPRKLLAPHNAEHSLNSNSAPSSYIPAPLVSGSITFVTTRYTPSIAPPIISIIPLSPNPSYAAVISSDIQPTIVNDLLLPIFILRLHLHLGIDGFRFLCSHNIFASFFRIYAASFLNVTFIFGGEWRVVL
ncbi:hypothetical protein D9615_008286 [Tricholomella constricta]|uniref:DNA 3'-5' helicase n=1 Tax=Tricholomella constricta TaxID=117010 RepID=A0A8H5HDI3_9AGAR|nr:hypothetical protein D9615_008286 [Tricholomella constricta]